MKIYECVLCSFKTPYKTRYTGHLKTKKHLRNLEQEKYNHESVEIIWLAKEEMNLFSDKGKRDWQKSNLIIGNPKHLNIASKMAQLSITVVKDKNDLLNKISDYENIAHLSITEDKNSQRYLLPMKNQLNSSYPDLMEIIITEKVNDKKINEIVDKLKNVDLAFISIVVRIRMNKGIATIDPSYAELLKKLHKKGIQFIVTSFGSPYLPDYEYIDTYIAAFGYGSVLVKAAANALLTNNNITGRLPVDLNNQFIRGSQVLVYREESIIDKLDISYSL